MSSLGAPTIYTSFEQYPTAQTFNIYVMECYLKFEISYCEQRGCQEYCDLIGFGNRAACLNGDLNTHSTKCSHWHHFREPYFAVLTDVLHLVLLTMRTSLWNHVALSQLGTSFGYCATTIQSLCEYSVVILAGPQTSCATAQVSTNVIALKHSSPLTWLYSHASRCSRL